MKPRKATPNDIPRILEIINKNLDKLLPREREDLERLIESFIVIEEGNSIVGCCCLEVYSPKIAEIRSVAVDAPFRKKGYGSLLVKAAVAEAERLKVKEIMVITSNPEFFQRLKFSYCIVEKYALFYKQ